MTEPTNPTTEEEALHQALRLHSTMMAFAERERRVDAMIADLPLQQRTLLRIIIAAQKTADRIRR